MNTPSSTAEQTAAKRVASPTTSNTPNASSTKGRPQATGRTTASGSSW